MAIEPGADQTRSVGADAGELRAVFHGGGSAQISLFPLDASSRTVTIATFALAPTQELPLLLPGGIVRVLPDLSAVYAGNVAVHLGRKLKQRRPRRRFGRRGDVLVNPQTLGFEPTSGGTLPEAFSGVPALDARLSRERRRFRWNLAGGAAAFGVGAAIWISSSFVDALELLTFTTIAFVPAVSTSLRTRRSQAALDGARATSETTGTRMQMRLWWSVGSGEGPVPIATLTPLVWAAEPVEYSIPLANVPEVAFPSSPVPVTVHGDAARGQPASIQWDTVTLWPAHPTMVQPARALPDPGDG